MKRLFWEFEHALPYLGLPGLIGIALLLLAGVLELGLRPPQELKRANAESELVKLQLKPLRASAPPPARDPAERFKGVDQMPAYLQTIMQIAAKNGLSIPRGQYAAQRPEVGGLDLIRYTLNLPINGSYPAIRHFSQQVQQAVPGAALTQLSFSRDAVQTPTVQANVEFTLWLKEGAR